MQNLWREDNGVFDVMCGSNITSTIAEAITLATEQKRLIAFEFNGVVVKVDSGSEPKLIYRDWDRALCGYIAKNVGPRPSPVLTDVEKVSDASIEAKNEERRQKRRAEYDKKACSHRERVEAKLANTPAIELADEAGWQKFKDANTDGYGGGVITYAERWARLMQVEMANGKSLKEVAEATSSEADIEGITGFMYGAAVAMLSKVWIHGDQFRRWHNLKTQIGHEGEQANEEGNVLNPAVLRIG